MSTATAPASAALMTAEEFFEWANRPENADRRYELENGRVIEVPSPSGIHGLLNFLISLAFGPYLIARGGGYAMSNDTGLIIRRRPDTVRGPDFMLFLEAPTYFEVSRTTVEDMPTLVIEVYSPSDRPGRLSRRIAQYHARGIPLVWVVYPEDLQVDVHRPGRAAEPFEIGDTFSNFPELPGFSCPVAALFTLPGQQPPTAAP